MTRVDLFGVSIDAVRMDEAVGRIMNWVDEPFGDCRYVVTPNADHTVMLQEHEGMHAAYVGADMVLADGFPVVMASWLFGRGLPERVAGADLVPAIFDAADPLRPLRVFLLGAAPGVADRAALRIAETWAGVNVVDTFSPALGFERDEAQLQDILDRVNRARPDILVIGLGAPKQEVWMHRHRGQIGAPVALCVGATIDFLAGEKKRAPKWLRRLHLEWLYRILGEPRRLFWRYARDAWVFPQLVWREWRGMPNMVEKPTD